MKRFYAILVASVFVLAACGGSSTAPAYESDVPTSAPPIVSRVEPISGAPGDPITIFGFGFTMSIPENIVIIGGAATTADSYSLLPNPTSDEIEAITCTVPAAALPGEGPIFVQVHGNQSNSDVSFTVLQ